LEPPQTISAPPVQVAVWFWRASGTFAPVDVAVQRWQDGLSRGDPHDLVISHPTAGHGIRINGHDMHAAPVFAPGYLHEQIDWLREIDVLR